jgi:hypothetical protein
MSDALFEAQSPLGYGVTCSAYQWNNHIITNHCEMDGLEDEVAATIERPCAVYVSNEYDDRHVYFKENTSNKKTGRYNKVVVSLEGDPNAGEIVTAMTAHKFSGVKAQGVLYVHR